MKTISNKTHKLARELGCDLKNCVCGGFPDCICDNNRISQSALRKWLREDHKIDVVIMFSRYSRMYYYKLYFIENGVTECITIYGHRKYYEEALEYALWEAIHIIKNKINEQKD